MKNYKSKQPKVVPPELAEQLATLIKKYYECEARLMDRIEKELCEFGRKIDAIQGSDLNLRNGVTQICRRLEKLEDENAKRLTPEYAIVNMRSGKVIRTLSVSEANAQEAEWRKRQNLPAVAPENNQDWISK